MDFNPELFQKNLAYYRDKKGLTQEQLGELLEMDRFNIGRYETGGSMPKIPTLVKIADILNVSLDELFFGKDTIENVLKEPQEKYFPKGEENTYLATIDSLNKLVKILENDLKNCTEERNKLVHGGK